VTSPEPSGSSLSGVTSSSPSDAWAVGQYSTSSGLAALLLHWDGTSWMQVTVPLPSGTVISGLSGVSADSPTDAWAVGNYETSSGAGGPLILHWNGTTWTQVASPAAGLFGVTAVSPSDAWAVGTDSVNVVPHTAILHWNGTAWATVPSPNPGGANGDALYGIGADGTADAWAVGTHQNSSTAYFNLILHWNGTTWTRS
jgi:hypothetical protein